MIDPRSAPTTSASHVPLIPYARDLAEKFPGEMNLYGRLYRAIMNGGVPAVQKSGRWYVDPADEERIVSVLGLPPAAPVKAPAPRAGCRSATVAASAAVPA